MSWLSWGLGKVGAGFKYSKKVIGNTYESIKEFVNPDVINNEWKFNEVYDHSYQIYNLVKTAIETSQPYLEKTYRIFLANIDDFIYQHEPEKLFKICDEFTKQLHDNGALAKCKEQALQLYDLIHIKFRNEFNYFNSATVLYDSLRVMNINSPIGYYFDENNPRYKPIDDAYHDLIGLEYIPPYDVTNAWRGMYPKQLKNHKQNIDFSDFYYQSMNTQKPFTWDDFIRIPTETPANNFQFNSSFFISLFTLLSMVITPLIYYKYSNYKKNQQPTLPVQQPVEQPVEQPVQDDETKVEIIDEQPLPEDVRKRNT